MSHIISLRNELKDHFDLCKTHALRLSPNGDVSEVLQECGFSLFGKDENHEEGETTPIHYRQSVIDMAKRCDHSSTILEEYIKGYEKLSNGQVVEDVSFSEIEKKIKGVIHASQEDNDSPSSGAISSGQQVGKMEHEIRKILGMPMSGQGDDGDEEDHDDDVSLVMDRTTGGGGTTNNRRANNNEWICPLTRSLLNNPVKNRVCGHAFSKDAIMGHLKISHKCPVAGCSNRKMKASDLEESVELTQMVRRHKRRLDAEKELMVDDDDEDGEELEEADI